LVSHVNTQIAVRRMSAADIAPVAQIYAEALDPSYISFSELAEGKAERIGVLSKCAPSIFREQLISILDSPQHGLFVASAARPVGFALASLHQAEAGHIECWLDDIAVRQIWRRSGTARCLVQHVIEWGETERAKYFLLESGIDNHAAHHLFAREGFVPLSTVFWRAGER
jgi:GNAT superfamily N-acetyltransferase